MRQKLHKTIENGLQSKTLLSGDERPGKQFKRLGDGIIDKKI